MAEIGTQRATTTVIAPVVIKKKWISYRSTSSIRKGGRRNSRRIRIEGVRVGPSTNELKGVKQIKQNTKVTLIRTLRLEKRLQPPAR